MPILIFLVALILLVLILGPIFSTALGLFAGFAALLGGSVVLALGALVVGAVALYYLGCGAIMGVWWLIDRKAAEKAWANERRMREAAKRLRAGGVLPPR